MNKKLADVIKKEIRKSADNSNAKQYLKDLVYQVYNGGIFQYCMNGYADDLLQYNATNNIVQELKDMNCPKDGIKAITKILEKLKEEKPYAACPECDGEGYLEYEDDQQEECGNCGGDGNEEVSEWRDADYDYWMGEFDRWFDSLSMDVLDDWTEQSHNHSISLDMMDENSK